MWSNTRALVLVSLLVIFSGMGLLWFGINSVSTVLPSPQPSFSASPVNQERAASTSATIGIEGARAQVLEVVDGDTIKVGVDGKEYTVRYVGMDTPETVDPRRPVGCFGKEASNENKSLVTGKMVILQKDVSETDKYGRLLRYIYLPLEDGRILFVNDYLVREGFAKVLTIPPDVKYSKQFVEAQNQAKEAKRGLWSRC